MKRYLLIATATLGFLAFVLGLGALTAFAQEPAAPGEQPPEQALEISPPLLNLKADPGQTINTEILLRSASNGKLKVTSEINDFVAGDEEDGVPKLLTEPGESSPYSLKPWTSQLPDMTLEPKQITKLPVTITVPANAAPGGYYGVIRFTATPPELEGTGVALSASLGTLVLLTVSGDAKESLEIEEFFASKDGRQGTLFESTPLNFTVRLNNTGNLHQQPAGKIAVTDMFGNNIVNTFINQPPRNILPGSVRKFEASIDESNLGSRMLFGRYTAELTVTYGENKQTVTEKITFWVIPYRLIGIVIAALVIGFFLLRFAIKRYNERIIGRSRRRR